MPPIAFITMLSRHHILAATLAFITILADILVVTLAGVPYHPSEITSSF
jgi:hypothetical protein